MMAVTEMTGRGIQSAAAMELVELHVKELRLKDLEIGKLIDMLEKQAEELVSTRRLLSMCQEQLQRA